MVAETLETFALARELSELLSPDDALLAAMDLVVQQVLKPQLRADRRLLAADRLHPGLIDAMAAAARSALRTEATARLPDYRRAEVEIYVSRLSPDDLRAAITFHRSSLGLTMRRAALAGLNLSVLTDAGGDADAAFDAFNRSAGQSVLAALTPAERGEVLAFVSSDPARHLAAALRDVFAASTAMGQATAEAARPAITAELERLVRAAGPVT